MKLVKSIAAILFAVTVVGCDGGVVIRGEIVDQDGQWMSNCQLSLYSTRTGELLGSAPVEGEFDELFVVSPWLRRCRVEVSCRGTQEVFRTDNCRVTSGSLDLGRLTLGGE